MLAFYDDPTIKTNILNGLAVHRAADEIVQGKYWKDGKGCALGCTLESIRLMRGYDVIQHDSHATAEKETGIPRILFRLEDRIFEGLPNEIAKDWPERFTSAIRPGADLAMIWPRFALWILTEELPQYVTKRPKAAAAIADVAALYKEWCDSCKNPDAERWLKARKNAYATYAAYAAYATYAAYADATYAAYAAYAADATYADADAAADAAADADATYAAADADATYAAASRAKRARQEAYQRQADKLVELLKAA
jgi:hypothetical protein